jgi:hypothetical protein
MFGYVNTNLPSHLKVDGTGEKIPIVILRHPTRRRSRRAWRGGWIELKFRRQRTDNEVSVSGRGSSIDSERVGFDSQIGTFYIGFSADGLPVISCSQFAAAALKQSGRF